VTIEKLNLPWIDQKEHIRPTAIVLHWWQVPSRLSSIRWFLSALKRKGLSVQFAVTKDGKIYQLVNSPDVKCAHARCANDSAIGIEIQGFGAKELDRQKEQFNAVAELVAKLCKDYKINPEFRVSNTSQQAIFYGVTSHKEVDKYCLARRFWPKRDVHDGYVQRIIESLKSEQSL